MRRQTGYGGHASAGPSHAVRPDPSILPLAFEASDERADGHVRRVEIARDRITVRRAVRGMTMTIRLNVSDFLGVALRADDGIATLTLEHRDPGLSIPLQDASALEADGEDAEALAQAWLVWAETFCLPRLVASADGQLHDPYRRSHGAPRRRRCNAIARRRPRILMRRKPKGLMPGFQVHEGEREIIART